MNYLQERNDGLRRCLLSLAHSDAITENDELVTTLTMETCRNKRQKYTILLLVAVHADGVCAPQFKEMAFEICICIRLDKYIFYFFIDMIIPTIPSGESYILHK